MPKIKVAVWKRFLYRTVIEVEVPPMGNAEGDVFQMEERAMEDAREIADTQDVNDWEQAECFERGEAII